MQSSSESAPRTIVNDDRIYQAACGHPKDSSKIFPKELALLFQIAASGKDGILQGELRRATGQDKRSVPKRTDALRDKGYITKDTVYIKGSKTSHLALQRYATETQGDGEISAAETTPGTLEVSTPMSIRNLVHRIERASVEETRLELDHIAKLVGFTADAQKRALIQIIRCMERAGCLKRVKMALVPNAQAEDLKTYIQFQRLVMNTDSELFDKHSLPFSKPVNQLIIEEAAKLSPPTPEAENEDAQQTLTSTQWNPDRCVANMLSDAVCMVEPSGLSRVNLRDLITGPFMRRPLESLLTRLSYQGLLSQPHPLRHLAIIRASKLVEGSLEYAHFSLEALQQAAKDKTAQISLVPGAKQLLIPSTQGHGIFVEDEASGEPALDGFGFPMNPRTRSIIGTNASSLPERDQDIDAYTSLRQAGQLHIINGSLGVEAPEPAESRRVAPQLRTTKGTPGTAVPKVKTPEKPHGRPRKFMHGTEKFWQYHFREARREAHRAESEIHPRETVQDLSGKVLFEGRPDGFDETIINAKAAGLPLPAVAAHISQEWVRQTKAVLDRVANGAYVTPAGTHMGRTRYKSQLLIVRSHRLKEIDLSDKKEVPFVRYISSSAAHSFAELNFSPGSSKRLQATPKQARRVQWTRNQGSKTITEKAVKPGPRLGVFVEAAKIPPSEMVQDQPRPQRAAPLSAFEYQQVMDDTEPDSGVDDLPAFQNATASRRSSRTPSATSVASARSAQLKTRRRSTSSVAAATQCRPSRQRKLTQKVTEALQDAKAEANFELSSSSMSDTGNIPGQQEVAVESEPELETAGIQGSFSTAPVVNGNEKDEIALDSIVAQDSIPIHLDLSPEGVLSAELEPAQILKTGNKENEQPTSDTQSLPPVPAGQPRTQKRKSSDLDGEDEHLQVTSPKRPKPATPSQKVNLKLCRKIIGDLVMLASGAAPSEASTITRVMTNRWHLATGRDCPGLTMVKDSLKSLSESSRLRLMPFSFRGKDGVLKRKAILVHPNIDLTSQFVQSLKKNMIEADPSDYIPPEWQAEILPALNISGNKRGNEEEPQAGRRLTHQPPQLSPDHHNIIRDERNKPGTPQMPQMPVSSSRRRRSTAASSESGASSMQRRRQVQVSRTNLLRTPSPKVSSSTTAAFLTLKLQQPVTPPPRAKISANAAFLTLKVPRIGELPQVHIVNANVKDLNWRTIFEQPIQDGEGQGATSLYLPAVPIRFNPEVNFQRGTALPTPAAKRRSGLRRRTKGKHFDATTHEIIPDKSRFTLPKNLKSLSAIIEFQNATHEIEKVDSGAAEGSRFFLECDIVEAWERRCQHAIQASDMEWTFINHSTKRYNPVPAIAYWLLVDVNRNGMLTERPSFENESWPPFIATIQETAGQDAPSPSASIQYVHSEELVTSATPQRVTREKTGTRRKRKLSDVLDFVPSTPKRPKRTRTRTSKAEPIVLPKQDAVTEVVTALPQPVQKARKAQAPSHLKKLSADELYQFTITVICVRTLTGGIERHADWSIVNFLMPKERDKKLLEDCWTVNLDKHKSDIRALTESFQEKYLEALELGDVPTVNFEDLLATDWRGIVSWALKALNPAVAADSKKVLELPATRSEFFSKHKIHLNDTPSIRSIYHPTKIDKAEREGLHKATIFGTSLPPLLSPVQRSASADEISKLRSLLLSLIICPEDRYSTPLGVGKFYSTAPTENEVEQLMRPVHEQLEEKDRYVALRPGAQKPQGLRRWCVTPKFYEQFGEKNCLITAAMLKDAAKYKAVVLDEMFAKAAELEIPKSSRVRAGEMLSIMQLLGMGMIEVRPGADIPNSRYGVDWQRVGYQTSRLEKAQFGFGVAVRKTDRYVFGDVVGKRVAVDLPRGDRDDPTGTPIWVDVHGKVVREIWEMVLGSAIGIVSMRPGVDAEEISKSLGNAVGAWEVEVLLNWAEKAGFIKKTRSGSGWKTREWWWMCLGRGAEDDDNEL